MFRQVAMLNQSLQPLLQPRKPRILQRRSRRKQLRLPQRRRLPMLKLKLRWLKQLLLRRRLKLTLLPKSLRLRKNASQLPQRGVTRQRLLLLRRLWRLQPTTSPRKLPKQTKPWPKLPRLRQLLQLRQWLPKRRLLLRWPQLLQMPPKRQQKRSRQLQQPVMQMLSLQPKRILLPRRVSNKLLRWPRRLQQQWRRQ